MFSARLNVPLRSSTTGVRSYIANIKNHRTFLCFVQSKTHESNESILNKSRNNTSVNFRAINLKAFDVTSLSRDKNYLNFQSHLARNCSTQSPPENADIFGDLGDCQFEKIELDDDEKKEEKFVENEARVPRHKKLTPGGYANLIKSHIGKGNLRAALEVLNIVANNRDKPTAYMYNLLLRAFAVAGDFKQSRSLYAKMKKLGLERNAATYTSILNACSNYHHAETALDYLDDLRQEFAEKNIVLNETHYNTMIKAYGRHGKILEAFTIADLMRDSHLPTGEITFNSLLISAISDRQSGLRHALVIWHQMRRHAIKPTLVTYNLLLRAIRDTKLGDLKTNDVLIGASPPCKISLVEDAAPDILSYPPHVNSLVFTEVAMKTDETEDSSESSAKKKKDKNLPAKIDANGEKSLVDTGETISGTPLSDIHQKNRLILFGGATGILRNMEKHGVKPDTKSMTLLMQLVPQSDKCERSILNIAKNLKVPLDLDFFNMLMKKRSLRRDYQGAKEILDDIQRNGLCPDVITWGILALGCHTTQDARDLIDGMFATGHTLNPVIVGTLINNACKKNRFYYVLEIMELMLEHDIQPNHELSESLENFRKQTNEMVKSKKFSRIVSIPAFKSGFAKFCLRYPTWKAQMEKRKEEKREGKKRQKNY